MQGGVLDRHRRALRSCRWRAARRRGFARGRAAAAAAGTGRGRVAVLLRAMGRWRRVAYKHAFAFASALASRVVERFGVKTLAVSESSAPLLPLGPQRSLTAPALSQQEHDSRDCASPHPRRTHASSWPTPRPSPCTMPAPPQAPRRPAARPATASRMRAAQRRRSCARACARCWRTWRTRIWPRRST